MSIELIIGPMFSGKTTKLIERYRQLKKKHNCLAINHSTDNRYHNTNNKIISHDNLSIDAIYVSDLADFLQKNYDLHNNCDYIFINEAQFFENLKNNILYITKILEINVILCGLDYDYKCQQFGQLLDLKSFANIVYELTGKCANNKCKKKSVFTHRLFGGDDLVLIGSKEYIPVCEDCYKQLNCLGADDK